MRVVVFLLITVLGSAAYAIIGRPLTPFSYAGVARRTTRRAVWAGGMAVPVGVGMAGGVVTTLPPGCTISVPCGTVIYEPQLSGTTVVYVAH